MNRLLTSLVQIGLVAVTYPVLKMMYQDIKKNKLN